MAHLARLLIVLSRWQALSTASRSPNEEAHHLIEPLASLASVTCKRCNQKYREHCCVVISGLRLWPARDINTSSSLVPFANNNDPILHVPIPTSRSSQHYYTMTSASALGSKPVKRKYESDDEQPKPKRYSKASSSDESEVDVSSDEEECESEEIYDASDEPFPIHAAFDPGLKHITTTASKLVQEAHSNLKKHASKSTTLQNMQKNAEETLVPPKAEAPKIAFVGPTGEGM